VGVTNELQLHEINIRCNIKQDDINTQEERKVLLFQHEYQLRREKVKGN
jgi:hypothetical protein